MILAAGLTPAWQEIYVLERFAPSEVNRAAAVELYNEPYKALDELLGEIDRIDSDAVAAICRDFFAPEAHTVLSLGPAEPAH